MTKTKIASVIVAALVLVVIGYGIATWRQKSYFAAADDRERQRLAQIATNNAESDKLRADNAELRKNVATLSAKDEALTQVIAEHGGTIAAEEKKLEQINDNLKNDEAVASAPSDRCTRCRRYSANLIASKLISKPLTCADECTGTAR